MPKSFLPSSDSGLLAWSLHFATQINLAPGAFGLSAAQASAYQVLHDGFATSLEACEPTRRNQVATAAKNDARTALKNDARLLAKLVQGTASVTDAQKFQLGLNVKAASSPIPAPASPPAISVLATIGNTIKLRLYDVEIASKRGKPAGADGAILFSFVGEDAPADLGDWKFQTITSRTRLDVTFPATIAPGTKVWFTAFWFNERKQPGPAASPIATNIPGGAISGAALRPNHFAQAA